MQMQKSTLNTAATLTWLSNILTERFGHAFNLRVHLPNTLLITFYQDTRSIQLPLYCDTFTRTDSNLPCTHWDATAEGWQSALGSQLPAPGAASLPSPLITPTDNGMHVAYDILGLTYWMLSRKEEIGRTDLDEHGRFPATSSHAYKHAYLERPVVDEWLHILGQVIQRTWPGIVLKEHRYSMKVSHDVDEPSRYAFCSVPALARAMARDVIKRRDFKSALYAPWVRMNTRSHLNVTDPANTFDWIMDESDKYGLNSAFYFICGRTSSLDADYDIEHPAIRSLMRHIHERGHEIGLHPSFGTYKTPVLIKKEADRLRRIACEEGITQTHWGGRMHYLRWAQPITLQALAEAGLLYDSTMGYADHPGFRCGTSHEYQAFDPLKDSMLPLRVRPLIAMECSVIDDCYLGLARTDEALKKFQDLKNSVKAVGGLFTLLWHNNRFSDLRERKMYSKLLQD
jgi:hypothetical protein